MLSEAVCCELQELLVCQVKIAVSAPHFLFSITFRPTFFQTRVDLVIKHNKYTNEAKQTLRVVYAASKPK